MISKKKGNYTYTDNCLVCGVELGFSMTNEELDEFMRRGSQRKLAPEIFPNLTKAELSILTHEKCADCNSAITEKTKSFTYNEYKEGSSHEKVEYDDGEIVGPLNENIFKEDSATNFQKVIFYGMKYLSGHKGYIAGGCFKNIFNGDKVKDIDIFFECESDFSQALRNFESNERFQNIYENENAVGFKDVENDLLIDLVRSSFGKPKEMIDSFDFTITKFAMYSLDLERISQLDNLQVIYHEDFFTHLTLKRLVVDKGMDFPLNTYIRMIRYIGYGYSPCRETNEKIIRSINSLELPSDRVDLFTGFYNGRD